MYHILTVINCYFYLIVKYNKFIIIIQCSNSDVDHHIELDASCHVLSDDLAIRHDLTLQIKL